MPEDPWFGILIGTSAVQYASIIPNHNVSWAPLVLINPWRLAGMI
jgi:hypothetical protein